MVKNLILGGLLTVQVKTTSLTKILMKKLEERSTTMF